MIVYPRRHITGLTHRLINSRHPTVGIFDSVNATEAEKRAGFALEALTNDRLTLAAQRLSLIPYDNVPSGPNATIIMAAFLHANPDGGRFTDGRLGAWYAGRTIKTALRETLYHNTRRLRLSDAGFPNKIELREYNADIDCALVDVRRPPAEEQRHQHQRLYHGHDYANAQSLGVACRWPTSASEQPATGVIYRSVRDPDGECVCLYLPSAVTNTSQGDHYQYVWDAAGTPSVIKLTNVDIA